MSNPPWENPEVLALPRQNRMAYRLRGPVDGPAWVVLHGGPGGGGNPGLLRPFDLKRQRVIVPDQRGSGASRPRGRPTTNSLSALVCDLEILRKHLGLERWSVQAGSWGTVLALAYASRFPQRVERLVLRGAFALRWREVGGLLQSWRWHRGSPRAPAVWPIVPRAAGPTALARLEQLFRTGTPGVAARRALRHWNHLERAAAAHGMRRGLRHAASVSPPATVAAMRASWAGMQRALRRGAARQAHPGRLAGDRSALQKFRIQIHYLRRHAQLRPGALEQAVIALARHGVAVDWVHGRFDAVCPMANCVRWLALGQAQAPGLARGHWPLAGHLGHEPQMLATLTRLVRRPGF
ncbi:alpha/beta fold hydrolase [Hydrogenophaga sp.]|uniref:alpha/beta fold hydrolase n=1 Tax=Hydrogenophaga sp. TaxID=1904254 RepID=UPI0035640F85